MGQHRGILAQVSAAHLVSHFHIMTIPALLPLLPAAMGIGFVDLGIALAVFNIVTALVQAPLGYAVDRLGARRLLLAGLALGSASFALVSIHLTFETLVGAMALAGIANGVYHPSDYSLLSQNIASERIGRAFSIHTFAGFLGGALAPLVLIGIGTALGSGWALAASSALGLTVLTAISVSGWRPRPLQPAPNRSDDKSHRTRPSSVLTLAVLILTAFFLLLNLSTGAIEKFSVSALVQGFGVSLPTANLALAAFLFASAFGVLAGGVLADRTARHGIVAAVAFMLAATLVTLVILVPLPKTLLILMMGTVGFLTGSIAPSRDMLVRAAAPAGSEGRVFGIVSTGFNIGGVIGPIVFGYFLDTGFAAGVLWAAVGFMIATSLIVALQEWRLSAKRTASMRTAA